MRQSFKEYFNTHPNAVIVMDGGQGTELERRGVDVSSKVWSTVPFIGREFWQKDEKSQNISIVKDMFQAFVAAGSQALMSITYQCSFSTISSNTKIQALEEYNELLNKIVKFCRECIGNSKYLIGSIGPYASHVSAEYTGDYGLHPENVDYLNYFKPQLDNFNDNDDIDLIAMETVPNKYELKALLSWDGTTIKKPFYISLSVGDDGNLRDGTSMDTISTMFQNREVKNPNLMMVGVNCVSYDKTLMIIKKLQIAVPDLPLVCYPNSGEVYDQITQSWKTNNDIKLDSWETLVKDLVANGVRMVGGCCRTTPDDIHKIAQAVSHLSH
ncbi:hypothetical protein TBLA_0B03260 [Henningerozyma blattae CBS 6284]|uniref:homocysteine S-methyltransferase n=1 Tax=Henningerozyma blattae (strain ATCC 34711 / CBS 6284 / DSM 70876 / NBRC 10599 / NRRL Y-10934 / UCD 77-7) TaxID=1071380 RepID=I2GYG5_HENB6|nr:hypothetical protein TBLA_0B03260 [Tetrapisispora blattae CBS 6284]CCH59167.1 hypothetical protein TBLA_0B03260 [Tetrapisispora blattae CBS 6284]